MGDDGGLFDLAELDEPTTRRCMTCRVERPLSMFYIERERLYREKRNVRVQYPCRICKRAANFAALAPKRLLIDRIKTDSGCVDCGIRDEAHPEIYDFDHLPGFEKTSTIAALVLTGTEEELLAEVAKCEVVCANCHRIRTRQREHGGFGVEYRARKKRGADV